MKRMLFVFVLLFVLAGCSPKIDITVDPGVDTVEVFTEHTVNGCTLTIDETEYEMNRISNPVNTDVVGEYIVEYSLKIEEEIYECQRVVFVVDQTAPEITLLPGIDTIYVGDKWKNGGAEATDNYDSEIMVTISKNTVDEDTPGTYEVTYRAADESGNVQFATRVVHVMERD